MNATTETDLPSAAELQALLDSIPDTADDAPVVAPPPPEPEAWLRDYFRGFTWGSPLEMINTAEAARLLQVPAGAVKSLAWRGLDGHDTSSGGTWERRSVVRLAEILRIERADVLDNRDWSEPGPLKGRMSNERIWPDRLAFWAALGVRMTYEGDPPFRELASICSWDLARLAAIEVPSTRRAGYLERMAKITAAVDAAIAAALPPKPPPARMFHILIPAPAADALDALALAEGCQPAEVVARLLLAARGGRDDG